MAEMTMSSTPTSTTSTLSSASTCNINNNNSNGDVLESTSTRISWRMGLLCVGLVLVMLMVVLVGSRGGMKMSTKLKSFIFTGLNPTTSPTLLDGNEETCVVFYHLPSASGLLRNLLVSTLEKQQGSFGGSRVSSWNLTPTNQNYSKHVREWTDEMRSSAYDARFIHGNFTFGLHEQLDSFLTTERQTPSSIPVPSSVPGQSRCKLVTMLRHPVERVISQLVHDKQPVQTWQDCIASGLNNCWTYRNDMTRRLSGINSSLYYEEKVSQIVSTVTPGMLAKAKKNLKKFHIVGISERLHDTTRVLSHQFNWHNFLNSLGELSSKSGSVRSTHHELKKLIEDTNQADMELYNYAIELFEKKLADSHYSNIAAATNNRIAMPKFVRIWLFHLWTNQTYLYMVSVCFGMLVGAAVGGGWITLMISRRNAKAADKALKKLAALDSTPTSTPTRRRKFTLSELC